MLENFSFVQDIQFIPGLGHHDLQMILRLLLAALLGGAVGLEREQGDRPAGLRTHVLVCVGSALFMLVSVFGFGAFEPISTTASDMGIRRDSARVAAQVVSGIGFLGAGTIIHEGLTIKGLTTAASLWMVSAIGLAVGGGMYVIATASTVITLLVLIAMHSWEKKLSYRGKSERRFILVRVVNRENIISEVVSFLESRAVKVKTINVSNNAENKTLELEIYAKVSPEADVMEVTRALQDIPGVQRLENAK